MMKDRQPDQAQGVAGTTGGTGDAGMPRAADAQSLAGASLSPALRGRPWH